MSGCRGPAEGDRMRWVGRRRALSSRRSAGAFIFVIIIWKCACVCPFGSKIREVLTKLDGFHSLLVRKMTMGSSPGICLLSCPRSITVLRDAPNCLILETLWNERWSFLSLLTGKKRNPGIIFRAVFLCEPVWVDGCLGRFFKFLDLGVTQCLSYFWL